MYKLLVFIFSSQFVFYEYCEHTICNIVFLFPLYLIFSVPLVIRLTMKI